MKLTLDRYHDGIGAELKCPNCEGDFLHHEKLEVFNRHEDEEEGLHVVVAHHEVHIDKNLKGNPSPRRHGLKIYFSCENCYALTVLSLAQHKGQTFIDLEHDGPVK